MAAMASPSNSGDPSFDGGVDTSGTERADAAAVASTAEGRASRSAPSNDSTSEEAPVVVVATKATPDLDLPAARRHPMVPLRRARSEKRTEEDANEEKADEKGAGRRASGGGRDGGPSSEGGGPPSDARSGKPQHPRQEKKRPGAAASAAPPSALAPAATAGAAAAAPVALASPPPGGDVTSALPDGVLFFAAFVPAPPPPSAAIRASPSAQTPPTKRDRRRNHDKAKAVGASSAAAAASADGAPSSPDKREGAKATNSSSSPAKATHSSSSSSPTKRRQQQQQHQHQADAGGADRDGREGEGAKSPPSTPSKKKKGKKKKKKKKSTGGGGNPDGSNEQPSTKPKEGEAQRTDREQEMPSAPDVPPPRDTPLVPLGRSPAKASPGKKKKRRGGGGGGGGDAAAPTNGVSEGSPRTGGGDATPAAAADAPPVEISGGEKKGGSKGGRTKGNDHGSQEKLEEMVRRGGDKVGEEKGKIDSDTGEQAGGEGGAVEAKDPGTVASKVTVEARDDSSPNTPSLGKKGAPARDHQAGEDVDDGAWETVEVKPRGRRGRGGGGGKKPSAQQPQQQQQQPPSQGGHPNNGKAHSSGGNHNNSSHNNNGHVNSGRVQGGDQDGRVQEGGNNDPRHHGGGTHGSDRRRSKRHHRHHHRHGDKGQRSSGHSQINGNNDSGQQQHKLVKEVLAHILDAVDEEVNRNRGGARQGQAKPEEGHKRRSTGGRGATPHAHGPARGKQATVGAPPAITPPRPPASLASNPSAKCLRDILVGASCPPAKEKSPGEGIEPGGEGRGGGDSVGDPLLSAKKPPSSKVKPGFTYKSIVEPDKPPEPKADPPELAPSKPRPNAWARPSAKIKEVAEKERRMDLERNAALAPAVAVADKVVMERSDAQPPAGPVTCKGRSSPLPHAMAADAAEKMADTAPSTPSGVNESKGENIGIEKEEGGGRSGEGTKPSADVLSTTHQEKEQEGEDAANASCSNGNDPSPPLSTLLGPGLATGSASSSVASSLEVPHAAARLRRASPNVSGSGSGEDDVGFHLLNVCDQLSDEIRTFMERRATALDVRRRERRAVLGALGDTLGKIWPGLCCVEMYGSCATQLDLPSSDLDLVVCGLDDVVVDHAQPVGVADPRAAAMQDGASSGSFRSMEETGTLALASPDHRHATTGSSSGMCTPDQPEGSVAEGVDEVAPDEGADSSAIDTDQFSPLGAGVDNYPPPEYLESNHQEIGMENFSPGVYSYHSQQDMAVATAAAETYHTPDGTSGGMVAQEGYHEYQMAPGHDQYYYSPYSYVPTLSPNAQRVLRLASELEMQPWAVQVKAIPTATVPVVKMLADPSRLPGLVGPLTGGGGGGEGGSWVQMQQRIASGTVVPPPPVQPMSPDQVPSPPVHSPDYFPPAHSALSMQWRGTDIKNGLQPVDITFEGPEHGGIGSTTYSARVVQDACDGTRTSPEDTPLVQAASVLKELLAQRRLNEPFSGGLSSYGLLLLLLAVLKDRDIIQGEMREAERQQREVSCGSSCGEDGKMKQLQRCERVNDEPRKLGAPAANSMPASQISTTVGCGQSSLAPSPVADSSVMSGGAGTSRPATVSSSWASIAKKSNASTARTESLSTLTKSTNGSSTAAAIQRQGRIDDVSKSVVQGNDQATMTKQKDAAPHHGSYVPVPEEPERPTNYEKQMPPQSSNAASEGPVALSQVTPCSEDDGSNRLVLSSSARPQGSNDVFEVLCTGELTSGKLLMHFLLFYGQHFDAQSTLIDVNGTHHPDHGRTDPARLSPFVPRPPGGTIDPVTGMFSVDPLVVYDPLEGAMDHNVSKRCYCWNNVRWVFAQCYMTVASIVEGSDVTCGGNKKCLSSSDRLSKQKREAVAKSSSTDTGSPGKNSTNKASQKQPESLSSVDGAAAEVVTPILELLLSF
ncbi:hypothetical protein ACHAWF_012883 [Thalassiosira exigua]